MADTDLYYVYIIKSSTRDWYYVGFTRDINCRIKQHNAGLVRSTRNRRPFILLFAQEINSRLEARDLEKFLKISFNKEALLEKM